MRGLILIIVAVAVLMSDGLDSQLRELSSGQKLIMKKVYKEGAKHELELTMTAICWEESQFGKYMVNISDPSFGYFHNSVKTIQRRHRANNWNTSRLIERLLYDFDFGFSQALIEVQFWQKAYRNEPRSWSKTVSSYNAGYKYTNGRRYLERIKLKMKALKRYIKSHEHGIYQ